MGVVGTERKGLGERPILVTDLKNNNKYEQYSGAVVKNEFFGIILSRK